MSADTQSKMLDLLDQAYSVTEDSDRLDALLESAHRYLFEDQQNAIIAKNLPHFADLDPHLESHISRLEDLIERRVDDEKLGLSIGHHGQMIINNKGMILTVNSQAKALLSGAAEGYIDKLPLSHDSIHALRDIIAEITVGVQRLERVIYLQIETDTPRSAFGYCRALPISEDEVGLHISLSYFDWSPAIFASLQSALGLSESEGLVLQSILMGHSHKEIAQRRNRSVDTIKTQAKAILRKARCTKMNDLVHLCTSIAYVIGLSERTVPAVQKGSDWTTPRQGLHTLSLPQGRTLAYYEYGDPKGVPVLFIHGFFQGPYFLDGMKSAFMKSGLRVIAPSRPHFGYTSAPLRRHGYNATACEDVIELINHLNLKDRMLIVTHHGGVSHAFRLAKRIEGQLTGMVMIGAGIPITSEHIRFMTRQARMTSVASRHAPSVLKLIATMGIRTYRKKGVQAFLEDHYSPTPFDRPCIHDPLIQPNLYEGMFHLVEQGADAFVHDGRSQLADWTEDFKAVHCRQIWLHGRHCHLMGAHFVADYVRSHSNHSVEILEDVGYNILYQCPDRVAQSISEAAEWI
ncbi:MAG: alpha/beta hydrolase [Robiginitomaculum sp.]|nr:alpha/beta hydrolase [Robiginitomaculum sp.]MDQ7078440.1 alpha/beta hydrolase [Robiginitomaculum sp.]